MIKQLNVAALMVLTLILGQFSAAQAMAEMSVSGMGDEIAAINHHMSDCPGMNRAAMEDKACHHHAEQDYCKHHVSCSAGVIAPAVQKLCSLLKVVRQVIPPLTDNMASILLDQSTPPPRS